MYVSFEHCVSCRSHLWTHYVHQNNPAEKKIHKKITQLDDAGIHEWNWNLSVPLCWVLFSGWLHERHIHERGFSLFQDIVSHMRFCHLSIAVNKTLCVMGRCESKNPAAHEDFFQQIVKLLLVSLLYSIKAATSVAEKWMLKCQKSAVPQMATWGQKQADPHRPPF